jgi:hypothetical protein
MKGAAVPESENLFVKGFPLGNLKDDTTCTLAEHLWFVADNHIPELKQVVASWQGDRDLWCIDLFSPTGNVASQWIRHGFAAMTYDVKTAGRANDIVGKRGFLFLLRAGLRLRDQAIIVGGPPCSLNIFLSCSVHKRHLLGPMGDTANGKVRLSNLIAQNMAVFIGLLVESGRRIHVVIEQPASSWLFKLPFLVLLASLLGASVVTTWLGKFGHEMLKCIHLLGNLPGLSNLARKMSLADKAKHKLRSQLKQSKRKTKRCYTYKDKNGGVSGGKDLAGAAAYPSRFCNALFKLWQKSLKID